MCVIPSITSPRPRRQATREELLASAAAPVHGENPNMTCALCNLPLDEVPVQGGWARRGRREMKGGPYRGVGSRGGPSAETASQLAPAYSMRKVDFCL